MALREFLAIASRRWYVVLVGALMTGAAMIAVSQQTGVYWGKVTMVVLMPGSVGTRNTLYEKSPVAIATLIVTDVTRKPMKLEASAWDAPLYGMGRYPATQIQVRNSGNQWVPSAGLPYIDIQATDTSEAGVERRLSAAMTALHESLGERQDALRVSPVDQAMLEQNPAEPSVYHVAPSRARALGATAAVGLILTSIATVGLHRLRMRRQWRLSRSTADASARPQSVPAGVQR